MARAKVLFTNSFHVSPVIETDELDLFQRLSRASKEASPALAATRFLLITAATKRRVTIHNAPEGRTFGGTVTMLENEEFWPGSGDQAGVFMVYLETDIDYAYVSFWGGTGFVDSEEFTKKIPQTRVFEGGP